MSNIIVAWYEGRRYEIPDIWVMGFCRGTNRTIQDAVAHWHYQQMLAEGKG